MPTNATLTCATSEGAHTLLRLASCDSNNSSGVVHPSQTPGNTSPVQLSPATAIAGGTAATAALSATSNGSTDAIKCTNHYRSMKRPHTLELEHTPARKRPAYHSDRSVNNQFVQNGSFSNGTIWTPNGPLPVDSLQSPDLQMLKLGTPDLERIFTTSSTPLPSAGTLQNALNALASSSAEYSKMNADSNVVVHHTTSNQMADVTSDTQASNFEMSVTQEQVQYAKGFELALQRLKNGDQNVNPTNDSYMNQNGSEMQSNVQMYSNSTTVSSRPTSTESNYYAAQPNATITQMPNHRQDVSSNTSKIAAMSGMVNASSVNQPSSVQMSSATNMMSNSTMLAGSSNSNSMTNVVGVSQPTTCHVQSEPQAQNPQSSNAMRVSYASQVNCTPMLSTGAPYIKQEKAEGDDSGFIGNSICTPPAHSMGMTHMYPIYDLCQSNNGATTATEGSSATVAAVAAAAASLAGAGLLSLPSNSNNNSAAADCSNNDCNQLLYDTNNAYGSYGDLQYNLNQLGQLSNLSPLNGLNGLNQLEAANLFTNNLLPNGANLANSNLMNSGNATTVQNALLSNVSLNSSQATSAVHLMSGNAISPVNMEEQERVKLERKRLRNRIAASKCRKRKLERISKLEEKVNLLKGDNEQLNKLVAKLRNHVSMLKDQMMEHVNSGCNINPAIVANF
jgi:hypothetical protein